MNKAVNWRVPVAAAAVFVAAQASADIRGSDPNGVLPAMQTVGFADTLDGWRQDVESFERFIGW